MKVRGVGLSEWLWDTLFFFSRRFLRYVYDRTEFSRTNLDSFH